MSERTQASVLVVEDEPDLQQLLLESLEADGFAVAQSFDGADARDRIRGFAYDALVVDLRLPDANGMDILDEALTRYPEIKAVVITGVGGVAEAVTAVRRGAIDVMIKPFQLAQLSRTLRAAVEQRTLRQENAALRAKLHDRFRFENIIGRSPAMKDVFSTLELVSPMNSTVLIVGETGTGKELIARTIHHNSPRSEQPFVAFNAAAIPEGLAETELFGHVKGAFTGAVAARSGRFELAHRGTLFIDEVASMSLALQSKLLRALQERQLQRVGESKNVSFDVRIIAATNVDLRKMVKEGTFREDLYYRLNVIPVRLPPLRQRADDLPLLSQHFVQKACESNRVPSRVLGQEVMRVLMAHDWPGNIRQLENAMEFAVAMSAHTTEITPAMLPEDIRHPDRTGVLQPVLIPDEGLNFTAVVSQLERDLILGCLEKTGGNKRQAARLLQLSRTTLIDKLQRLTPPAQTSAA
ncbi:MAG: sigma-54-dependent Fis family transcriptional regulator [Acidobacteria bacterium]|nr:sigma-54-dependent Fis family transcriptional regulator [Acidobacteriota bacterium]